MNNNEKGETMCQSTMEYEYEPIRSDLDCGNFGSMEAPSVGAALTSKGLRRCAMAPIESFTSSVPYLHMKMACFQVHLNQGLIWLPPSLSILSCVAAGGLTLHLQMVSSQPFICDYLWQKHYQNLYGACELSVCRVGPFLSGPQRA